MRNLKEILNIYCGVEVYISIKGGYMTRLMMSFERHGHIRKLLKTI